MLETVRWITAEGKVLAGLDAAAPLLPGKLRIIDQTRLPGELVAELQEEGLPVFIRQPTRTRIGRPTTT